MKSFVNNSFGKLAVFAFAIAISFGSIACTPQEEPAVEEAPVEVAPMDTTAAPADSTAAPVDSTAAPAN
jgi:hypothetical protein